LKNFGRDWLNDQFESAKNKDTAIHLVADGFKASNAASPIITWMSNYLKLKEHCAKEHKDVDVVACVRGYSLVKPLADYDKIRGDDEILNTITAGGRPDWLKFFTPSSITNFVGKGTMYTGLGLHALQVQV